MHVGLSEVSRIIILISTRQTTVACVMDHDPTKIIWRPLKHLLGHFGYLVAKSAIAIWGHVLVNEDTAWIPRSLSHHRLGHPSQKNVHQKDL